MWRYVHVPFRQLNTGQALAVLQSWSYASPCPSSSHPNAILNMISQPICSYGPKKPNAVSLTTQDRTLFFLNKENRTHSLTKLRVYQVVQAPRCGQHFVFIIFSLFGYNKLESGFILLVKVMWVYLSRAIC